MTNKFDQADVTILCILLIIQAALLLAYVFGAVTNIWVALIPVFTIISALAIKMYFLIVMFIIQMVEKYNENKQ